MWSSRPPIGVGREKNIWRDTVCCKKSKTFHIILSFQVCKTFKWHKQSSTKEHTILQSWNKLSVEVWTTATLTMTLTQMKHIRQCLRCWFSFPDTVLTLAKSGSSLGNEVFAVIIFRSFNWLRRPLRKSILYDVLMDTDFFVSSSKSHFGCSSIFCFKHK